MNAKVTRGLRIGGLVVPVLLVLICAGFHWQGRRALDSYKRQLAAAGERLTIDQLKPQAAFLADNSAGALLQAGWRAQRLMTNGENRFVHLQMVSPGKAWLAVREDSFSPTFGLRQSAKTRVSWTDIAKLVEIGAGAREEIAEALNGSHLDYNLDYRQGFNLLLMHLAPQKAVGEFVATEALYALHEGQLQPAVQDIRTLLRLVQLEGEEPVVISQMVRLRNVKLAWRVNWEALYAKDWTDAQLSELQQAWASLDLLKPMLHALEMERAVTLFVDDSMRQSGQAAKQYFQGPSTGPPGSPSPPTGSTNDPRSWLTTTADGVSGWSQDLAVSGAISAWQWFLLDPAELHGLKCREVILDAARSVEKGSNWAIYARTVDPRLKELGSDSWIARFAQIIQPSDYLDRSVKRLAETDVLRQLMIASLALKRYHVRQGRFPETLDALCPEYAPKPLTDPIDGKPLRYRPQPDGTYLLYSVGWDAQDNSGDPESPSQGNTPPQITDGRDWVWPWPATAADIEQAQRHKHP